MSNLLPTALGLVFALFVCVLAVHAILGPWLRLRRSPSAQSDKPETTAVHMM